MEWLGYLALAFILIGVPLWIWRFIRRVGNDNMDR